MFQSYHLLDDLTVYENLEIPLSYRDVKKSERQAIVADTLDRFNIVSKKDLYPNQLSGGQQQLVAVARAIVANPKLTLADKPTGNLRSDQGREIMELFKKLNGEGTTIVQVTHSEINATYGNRISSSRTAGWRAEAEEILSKPRKARPRRVKGVTEDDARRLRLALPGVEEGPCYGTPGWRVKKRFLARLRDDGAVLVVKVGDEERDILMAADPKTFFITDHYAGYPTVLVRLANVRLELLREVLERAWRRAAPKSLLSAR